MDDGGIPAGYDFRPLWKQMHEEQAYENRCKGQQRRRKRERQEKLTEEYKLKYDKFIEEYKNRNKVALQELRDLDD